MKTPNTIDQRIEEFKEIQREWELHKTMNTCSICDSPTGHTEYEDWLRTALTQTCQQAVEEERGRISKEVVKIITKNESDKQLEKIYKLFNIIAG